ncbi:MAG: ParB/RepB/Spo0J family partition protein [Thermoanaerobaculia bacterium]|nr:ParB/RepB/Spo0J family partition protein [Thermoanaerobaculia bacterium]
MNTSPSTRERRRPPRTTLPHDPFEALNLVPGGTAPAQEPGKGFEAELRRVPLSAIVPSPRNPRKHFDAEGISELAASIAADGLRQPLELRRSPGDPGRLEVVAGERRFRALSKLVADGRLPADFGVPAQVAAELDDATMLLRAIVENLQRQDLHPLEEAEAFARLRDEHGLSTEQIATKAGKSQRWVQLRIALTELVPEARAAFADGRIGLAEARRLAGLEESEQRRGLVGLLGGRDDADEAMSQGEDLLERMSAATRTEDLNADRGPSTNPVDEPRDAGPDQPPPPESRQTSVSADHRGSHHPEALARALADSYPLALRFALAERQAILGDEPAGDLFHQLADLPLEELEVQFAEAVAATVRSSSPGLVSALGAELGLEQVA